MVLKGHTGSVLCLQYNEQVIVTGSSDSTIRYICTYVCGGGDNMHNMVHKYSILMADFECDGALFPWQHVVNYI